MLVSWDTNYFQSIKKLQNIHVFLFDKRLIPIYKELFLNIVSSCK